jgi:DNA-binding CsgD family transcriptional regulator
MSVAEPDNRLEVWGRWEQRVLAILPYVMLAVAVTLSLSAQAPLSQREIEVLEIIARGATNRETAARLFISEATVKTHLLHGYAKLGVSDRAAAVAEAFRRGLLTPEGP